MIRTTRLTKRYGDRAVVDRVSFTAPSGQVTGFLGPNGAGKSTTMRMLVGLTRPTSGTATVLGAPYAELPAAAARVGTLLDPEDLPGYLTARRHLQWYATAAGVPAARIGTVLAQVDLAGAADKKVRGYSLGMRQRLGLACALLADPEVLVLDEPANGLDPAGMRWLRDLLRRLAAEGRTVFLSTHLLLEVEQLADHIVVIHDGRVAADTTLAELSAGRGLEQSYLDLTREAR
ncbi:ABC transporter ATP-binding protein [Promicromonospora sp. NPDC052451]|uniref:ABC transporter ATP-binding protein n=1 Tax=Promicromonospora sp. NPDC052451 TaxID=3364407 RepID=UPI0037C81301